MISQVHIARLAFGFILAAILGLALLVFALSGYAAGPGCGVERTDVKDLKDPGGQKISSLNPQLTTVAAMLKLPLYSKGVLLKDADTRIAPTETTVYEIKAIVIGFKKETDQDIHIVIADPDDPKQTMIAEIPAGACMAPQDKKTFDALQAQFEDSFGKPTSKFKTLDSPQFFDVIGVGFFDFVHGQTGHAANGIELHPVLSFK